MYMNLYVHCLCSVVYSQWENVCVCVCVCVCPMESKTTGFATDTFMAEASGKKSSQLWQPWSWSAQISLHGNLLQGPWVIDRLQLPHFWVPHLDNVRPRFWGCSQPMTKHSREYWSRASGIPLMGNCGTETPHQSAWLQLCQQRAVVWVSSCPTLPSHYPFLDGKPASWSEDPPAYFTSSLFIWHRHPLLINLLHVWSPLGIYFSKDPNWPSGVNVLDNWVLSWSTCYVILWDSRTTLFHRLGCGSISASILPASVCGLPPSPLPTRCSPIGYLGYAALPWRWDYSCARSSAAVSAFCHMTCSLGLWGDSEECVLKAGGMARWSPTDDCRRMWKPLPHGAEWTMPRPSFAPGPLAS